MLARWVCGMCIGTDYRQVRHPEGAFFQKSQTFALGQTFWAEIFWGNWGIFSCTISIHFGTVISLSMFSIIQPLLLQKTKSLYPIWFEFGPQRIWDLAFSHLNLIVETDIILHLYITHYSRNLKSYKKHRYLGSAQQLSNITFTIYRYLLKA